MLNTDMNRVFNVRVFLTIVYAAKNLDSTACARDIIYWTRW